MESERDHIRDRSDLPTPAPARGSVGNADFYDDVVTGDRSDLYRYLASPRRDEYRAIMSLFVGPLLADLSPADVVTQLREAGVHLTEDEAYSRCESLDRWGNLVRGVRDTRVATIRDFHKGRSRFHASKLGGRVHRDVEGVLAAGDGAREVARELLGVTTDTLARILALITGPDATSADTAGEVAGLVTTVFNNQAMFSESVHDFYAYLNHVLTRYDLAGSEYLEFKDLLLGYINLIAADVNRNAPAILTNLQALEPHLDVLLELLDDNPALLPDDTGGTPERSPGRALDDWEHLTAWYDPSSGRSGTDTLRSAAGQALAQLLANAKRMLAATSAGLSRRSDLLKLAAWFDTADPDTAHRLFAATFGNYPARHLSIGPESKDATDGPATSWWSATPVEVPVSLRERGDQSARGRTSPVPDVGLLRERALQEAKAELAARRAAASELTAAGRLHQATVSPAARDLALDTIGQLIAVNQDLATAVAWTDDELDLTLTAVPAPGTTTRLQATDGTVIIHGLTLIATPAASTTTVGTDDEVEVTA